MEEQIKEMEKYAEENSVPIMQKRGIKFLCEFIKKNEIYKILEIGTAIGYSAIRMALTDEKVTIVSIERDQDRYIEAVKNIKKFKLENRITLILGDALNIDLKDKYDMIFIDAAKGQYTNFFNHYEKNLLEDGVIVSDNMEFHGLVNEIDTIENRNLRQLVTKIKKYREFLETNEKYDTKFYKVGDGIAITYRKGILDV